MFLQLKLLSTRCGTRVFTSIFRAHLIIIDLPGVGKDLAIGSLRWGGLCYLVRPVVPDKKYISIRIIIRGPK